MSIGWHWSKCNLPEKPNSRSHALRRVPVLQNARASLKATSISVCLDFSVSLGKSFCSSTMCIHFECNLDHIGNWTLQSTLIVFSHLGNVCTLSFAGIWACVGPNSRETQIFNCHSPSGNPCAHLCTWLSLLSVIWTCIGQNARSNPILDPMYSGKSA